MNSRRSPGKPPHAKPAGAAAKTAGARARHERRADQQATPHDTSV